MIRKILIEGVRTHERTEVELGRLTCLVGPNGSGKSTVLQAFSVLRGELPVSWERKGGEWKVLFKDSENRESGIFFETQDISTIHGASIPERFRQNKELRLVEATFFRPDSEVLRAASEYSTLNPTIGADGKQLAAVLASWKLSNAERFDSVVGQLRQIVPNLTSLRPNLAQVGNQNKGFDLTFDFVSASNIPAMAVSEGTLLALALISKLHETARTNTRYSPSLVVLIDDIDRGLHPDAQLELIKLFRGLAELKDLQIVMTTHSPYIVDALAPEEVCVLALDDTGTTRARMLSEIPGAERYRGMLSTGQLWSSQGESWVLEDQSKSKAS